MPLSFNAKDIQGTIGQRETYTQQYNPSKYMTRENFAKAVENGAKYGLSPTQVLNKVKSDGYVLEGYGETLRRTYGDNLKLDLAKKEERKSIIQNALGGITESLDDLSQAIAPHVVDLAVKLGFDRDKAEEASRFFSTNIETNQDSKVRRAFKTATDIGIVGGSFAAQGAAASKLPQLPAFAAHIFSKAEKIGAVGLMKLGIKPSLAGNIVTFAKKIPANVLEGATIASAVNVQTQETLPTASDIKLGAAIDAGAPLLFAGIRSVARPLAQKLQLSGLLNPQKLGYVAKSLRETGDDIENVTNRMFDKNIKGTKQQIVTKLESVASSEKDALRSALSSVKGSFKDSSVNATLEEIISAIGEPSSKRQIKELDLARSLLEKHNTVGLSMREVQGVKEGLDDLTDLYTMAGDVKAGQKKKDLAALRQELRGFIEDNVQGFDVRMANRDIAVAKSLSKYISYKDKADSVRALFSPFSSSLVGSVQGSLIGGSQNGSLEDRIKSAIVGAVVGGLLGSTVIKTNIASALNKIDNFIGSATKQELKQLEGAIDEGKSVDKQLNRKFGLFIDDVLENVPDNTVDNLAPSNRASKLDDTAFQPPKGGLGATQTTSNPMQVRGISQVDNVSQDILQEAKKYKSADEFVASEGIINKSTESGGTLKNNKGELRYTLDEYEGGKELIIDDIEVHKTGEKHGDKFMKKIEDIAIDNEVDRISLHAYEQSGVPTDKLKSFYERMGYSVEAGDGEVGYEMVKMYDDLNYSQIKSEAQLRKIREQANK